MVADSFRKNSSIAATVLVIGAEIGCLIFATEKAAGGKRRGAFYQVGFAGA